MVAILEVAEKQFVLGKPFVHFIRWGCFGHMPMRFSRDPQGSRCSRVNFRIQCASLCEQPNQHRNQPVNNTGRHVAYFLTAALYREIHRVYLGPRPHLDDMRSPTKASFTSPIPSQTSCYSPVCNSLSTDSTALDAQYAIAHNSLGGRCAEISSSAPIR